MNPVAVFDFTLKAEGITREQVEKWLKLECKTWTFQLEKGEETGYLHWQGRCSYRNKKKLRICNQILIQTNTWHTRRAHASLPQ